MIGKTLAHFRIAAEIGAGGMGEVYRAEDTKLGREVAIKVLPEAFVADPDRRARFEREARTLASLNHPNIASLYEVGEDDGTHFLVMELVSGEDLAARLARGPIPVDETIRIALQIADALEAAHERGIVHRDLKPANVKVDAEGRVKVLDFGLAKALVPDPGSDAATDVSAVPTVTYQPTRAGVIVGTAAYMSPEQARGRKVTTQSDIWAFGVLLWEMLTGERLFRGETLSDILAAVLGREPDLDALGPVPSSLRRLVGRCLRRDLRDRLHDVADARLELDEALGGEGETPPPDRSRRSRRALTWLAAWAALATIAALGAAGIAWRASAPGPPPDGRMVRFALTPATAPGAAIRGLALSSDDRFLAYSVGGVDDDRIQVREMATASTVPVEGTQGARTLAFSPDGASLAYWAAGEIRVVQWREGRSQRVAAGGELEGLVWELDGSLLFADTVAHGLQRAIPGRGEVERVTVSAETRYHLHPFRLPDGDRVLYSDFVTGEDVSITMVSGSGDHRLVIDTGSDPKLLTPDVLVFLRQGWLEAVRLDPTGARTVGSPVAVEGPVLASGFGGGLYTVSRRGSLAYVEGSVPRWQLGAYRGAAPGQRLPLTSANLRSPRVTPGGGRVSAAITEGDSSNIWLFDLETGARRRVTDPEGQEWWHVWIDDSRIVYQSSRRTGSLLDVYLEDVDGTAGAEMIIESTECSIQPQDWVPSRGELVYSTYCSEPSDGDLWRIGLGDRTPRPVLVGEGSWDKQPAVSPDGRWLAYASGDPGSDHVFVTTYPEPGRILQVSAGGGWAPSWTPDGSEIVYEAGERFVAVELTADPEPAIGASRTIYEGPFLPSRPWGRDYAIMPNGDLLLGLPVADEDPAAAIQVVLDWRRRVEALLDAGSSE